MIILNAGAAAAAAAAAARKRREEEESMTNYTSQDLADDWEFKILRSSTGSFSSPENLRRAIAEEAAAGWSLVEKFDNSRVRLKRPASAKQNDHTLSFDPYRTSYGVSETQLALFIAGGLFFVFAMMLVIMFSVTR